MIGFIDTLCTPLETTGHYSATANLCTLQFTAANNSGLSLLQCPVAVSWQRFRTQELWQCHWITHSKYRGTIAHIKLSLHSQTFNSTELHPITLMPQFLSSTPLPPSSYPGRLESRNSTDSVSIPSQSSSTAVSRDSLNSISAGPKSSLYNLGTAPN
jgi:hypothetical protein